MNWRSRNECKCQLSDIWARIKSYHLNQQEHLSPESNPNIQLDVVKLLYKTQKKSKQNVLFQKEFLKFILLNLVFIETM
jgi:hypothetical protein